MFTLLTLSYVVLGAIISASAARFGATLVTTWTGGDSDQLVQSRKYASGIALVGGGLAACTPVNPLLAVFLSAAAGLFTAFCLGLLFAGAKVPEQYGKLLEYVDAKAGELNSELAKPETKEAIVAQLTVVTDFAKAQVSNLVPNKDIEETFIIGTLLLDETKPETETKVDETAKTGEIQQPCEVIKPVAAKTGGSGDGGSAIKDVKSGAGDGGPKTSAKNRPTRPIRNSDKNKSNDA